MFTSLSLRIPHRLAIAVGVPLLALALSNAQSVWSGLAEARSMEQTLVLTELGGAMSNVVEGLQRERGLTAGFVGSQGEAALAARLDEQRALTDTAVAALRSAVADDRMSIVGQDFRDRLARTEAQLATLAEHRSRIDALETDLGAAMAGYTGPINTVLDSLLDGVRHVRQGEAREGLIALETLMRAKEAAGLERGLVTGLFGAGAVDTQAHDRVRRFQASQDVLLERFRLLSDAVWSDRLDAALDGQARTIADYRARLDAAVYGAPLPAGLSQTWFDAASDRIGAVRAVERDFSASRAQHAARRLAQVRRQAGLVVVIGLASWILAIILSVVIAAGIVRPLRRSTGVLAALREGDLNIDIPDTHRTDELGDLARAGLEFRAAARRQRELEAEQKAAEARMEEERRRERLALAERFETAVGAIVQSVSTASTELASSANALTGMANGTNERAVSVAAAAEQTSANVETVATASEEMSASIQEVRRQATGASGQAGEASSAMGTAVEQVSRLSDASERIGSIVRMIHGITEKTNLLALNATIEAARAGEAGRGFSIVAQEVKGLAAQTDAATSVISALVDEMQAATDASATVIADVSSVIEHLDTASTSIATAVEQQAAASREISGNVVQAATGTREVSANIAGVREAAAESSAATRQVLSASQELSRNSETLRAEVDTFLASVRAA